MARPTGTGSSRAPSKTLEVFFADPRPSHISFVPPPVGIKHGFFPFDPVANRITVDGDQGQKSMPQDKGKTAQCRGDEWGSAD